jgi:hypothetical protein
MATALRWHLLCTSLHGFRVLFVPSNNAFDLFMVCFVKVWDAAAAPAVKVVFAFKDEEVRFSQ